MPTPASLHAALNVLHYLRRSAIRRMVRKGISETVAMRFSGRETMSLLRRYDITSTDALDGRPQGCGCAA